GGQCDGDLRAAAVGLDEVDDRTQRLGWIGVANQQAVVRIERAGGGPAGRRVATRLSGRQRARTRHVARVQLEVLHLVAHRRVVEQTLVVGIVRVEGAVQRYRLARAGLERPDVAVGQAGEVAAGAVLPALAGEPVGLGRAARVVEHPARGEEDLL